MNVAEQQARKKERKKERPQQHFIYSRSMLRDILLNLILQALWDLYLVSYPIY